MFNRGGLACLPLWLKWLCLCVKRWRNRWGLRKQRRLLLRVSPALCLLAANLISEGKLRALPLQCRSLSLFGIRTINYFGNSFQLIKTVPDRDCWTNEFPLNVLASFPILGLLRASSESWGFLVEVYLNLVFIFLFFPLLSQPLAADFDYLEDHTAFISSLPCVIVLIKLPFSAEMN